VKLVKAIGSGKRAVLASATVFDMSRKGRWATQATHRAGQQSKYRNKRGTRGQITLDVFHRSAAGPREY